MIHRTLLFLIIAFSFSAFAMELPPKRLEQELQEKEQFITDIFESKSPDMKH